MSGTAPVYSDADFLSGMQKLLPTGPAWPRDSDAVQTQVLLALIKLYTANAAAASGLLVDGFPTTTVNLLPEWELTLGLPDPCAGESPTIEARRAQVVARFEATGGQSAQYFINFAATLGYTITIDQFAPFRAGYNRAGDPDNSEAWAFAWRVNAPLFTVAFFHVGSSAVGEPLASWGSSVLECELERMSPAHTTLIINNTAG
jgi:uncharacterized protein YmfQ (DUF2313 family)